MPHAARPLSRVSDLFLVSAWPRMDSRRRRRPVDEGGSGFCPCRTWVLLLVLGFNVLLFTYNFPNVISKPSSISWGERSEVRRGAEFHESDLRCRRGWSRWRLG